MIAATILGGVSLFGGEGNILGVLLRALLTQVLRSAVVLMGFPVYWQQAAMGVLMRAAIVADRRRHRTVEGV